MVLVIGASGMLGSDVCKQLALENILFETFSHDELDISSFKSCESLISNKFSVIINCAAYTAVDKAEEEDVLAYKINSIGPKNLAVVAKNIGAKLIHVSTDYVFWGNSESSYSEYDVCNPQSVYGKTKLQGEMFIRESMDRYFIVRTAWLFGHGGNNFVKTMLGLKDKEFLNVVNDQFGQPTYTVDVAKKIVELLKTDIYGIYHITSSGKTSWFEFARTIFSLSGLEVDVRACSSDFYKTVAKRPSNSTLKHLGLQVAGLEVLPDWKDALERYLKEEI